MVLQDLHHFQTKSREGLRYKEEDNIIFIQNKAGELISTLNLQFVHEKIYCDSWFGFVTAEEYREIMSGPYLSFFLQTGCVKKICNTQKLEIGMDVGTSGWFVKNLLPKLLKAGLRYNAIIIPRDIYAQQSMAYFEENMKNDLARLFPDVESAMLWMRSIK